MQANKSEGNSVYKGVVITGNSESGYAVNFNGVVRTFKTESAAKGAITKRQNANGVEVIDSNDKTTIDDVIAKNLHGTINLSSLVEVVKRNHYHITTKDDIVYVANWIKIDLKNESIISISVGGGTIALNMDMTIEAFKEAVTARKLKDSTIPAFNLTYARRIAKRASIDMFHSIGCDDHKGACGFAWTNINNKIRLDSVQGKELLNAGFFKEDGVWQLWNPGRYRGQNLDCIKAGAIAYSKEMNRMGFNASWGSKLD